MATAEEIKSLPTCDGKRVKPGDTVYFSIGDSVCGGVVAYKTGVGAVAPHRGPLFRKQVSAVKAQIRHTKETIARYERDLERLEQQLADAEAGRLKLRGW